MEHIKDCERRQQVLATIDQPHYYRVWFEGVATLGCKCTCHNKIRTSVSSYSWKGMIHVPKEIIDIYENENEFS